MLRWGLIALSSVAVCACSFDRSGNSATDSDASVSFTDAAGAADSSVPSADAPPAIDAATPVPDAPPPPPDAMPSPDAPPLPIQCGPITCATECCFILPSFYECEPIACIGFTYECDGEEDCGSGEDCCSFAGSTSCQSEGSCSDEVCHEVGTCTDSAHDSCDPMGGHPFPTCYDD